jgi:uncharacterized protein (TIGR03083 family)
MELNESQLFELALDSATAGPTPTAPAPSSLREQISLRASEAAGGPSAGGHRHPGWSRPEPSGVGPLDALVRTASEFGALLQGLHPDDWALTTRLEGTTIREIVVHLVGMERYLLGQLGRGRSFPADRRDDHWPVTRKIASDLSDEDDATVAVTWWQEFMVLISACAELGPDHAARYHHLAGTVRVLLVARTFELWAHGDDIRAATERPLDLLDEGRLSLMVGELMGGLPLGLALVGASAPGKTARFELSGAGGGTFTVPLAFDTSAGTPDVLVRTDTVSLCRLAANRLRPSELSAIVEGDRSLLAPLLAGAAAFSAD